jgi:oligopeptide transport system ATP-binding protein
MTHWPLLEVRDLTVRLSTRQGVVHAVNGISYRLDRGETLALVGESGSGKSLSALALLGLLPRGGVVSGQALFRGRDLLALAQEDLRKVRGTGIAMVFQDPATSLNPVLPVGEQVVEGLREHRGLSAKAADRRAAELLSLVGIPGGRERLRAYPHELSGGQRQRVLIAMALSCEPALLVADEPTTALDVTVQAQVAQLLKRLQRELGMAMLWITHDLALVAGLVDRVAVMYAGQIVEQGPVREVFASPQHPYTRGLLRARPRFEAGRVERLTAIPGSPPDLRQVFSSCPFAPRCPDVMERCHREHPPSRPAGPGRSAACWLVEES